MDPVKSSNAIILAELYSMLKVEAVLSANYIYLPSIDKYIRVYNSDDKIPRFVIDNKIVTINEIESLLGSRMKVESGDFELL